jgi:hypothetical protein
MMNTTRKIEDKHPDPVSGAPASRPFAVGMGASGGGLIGAVAGAVAAGPLGAAAGAVVGSVIGSITGHAIGESVDPSDGIGYWRAHHHKESYYEKNRPFEDYEPAYALGIAAAAQYPGREFDDALDAELGEAYARMQPAPVLSWSVARHPVYAAYRRQQTPAANAPGAA